MFTKKMRMHLRAIPIELFITPIAVQLIWVDEFPLWNHKQCLKDKQLTLISYKLIHHTIFINSHFRLNIKSFNFFLWHAVNLFTISGLRLFIQRIAKCQTFTKKNSLLNQQRRNESVWIKVNQMSLKMRKKTIQT